jgi:soluble lytic murein transglycosylase-like protein
MAAPSTPHVTFPTKITARSKSMQAQLVAANGFRPFIEAAATQFGFQPSIICGIGSRESGWGLLLKPPGPGGTGDFARRKAKPPLRPGSLPPDGLGFGRGLMQIDFDSNPLAQTGKWQDPETNINFGCELLAQKLAFVQENSDLQDLMLLRGAIAAYNCGEGTVCKLAEEGLDVDAKTTGHNYSADVLNRAGFFQLHGWA